jgi:predicted short-subunit dehydrogenase-like oxidoreductase (DUF2520 family)
MTVQRGVAVIGLGNWGSSLTAALERSGLLAERVHARRPGKHPRLDAECLWLCVPDAAIEETSAWLADVRCDMRGQVVVHSSGALNRTVLRAAGGAGARTGSVHPMMSFPTRTPVALRGTRFAIEAEDLRTRRLLSALLRRMGGIPFTIDSAAKAMYHAAAMFGSPFIVATLAAGVNAMRAAGLKENEALALLGPMTAATVANVQKRGLARSFSGPLARGDSSRVKLHRKALEGHPLEAHVYESLARLAARDLPSKNRAAIGRVLDSTSGMQRSRE